MKSLEDRLRYFVNVVRDFIYKRQTEDLVSSLSDVLKEYEGKIPVFIISYNNAVYVKNMVEQLKVYDIKPVIIDNNSNDFDSVKILKELESDANVIYLSKNFGYLVGFINSVYEILPTYFVYTDPDLELNKNLPDDFLDVLKNVTEEFKVYKAGFALELLDEQMIDAQILKYNGYPKIKHKVLSMKEWEKRHWRFKLSHPTLELYQTPLDTTFALYNKNNLVDNFYDGIRVGGDFSCIHLPWYPQRDIMSKTQKKAYLKDNNSSTWVG